MTDFKQAQGDGGIRGMDRRMEERTNLDAIRHRRHLFGSVPELLEEIPRQGGIMKAREFFAMIEKAKKEIGETGMEEEMTLYVSNPHSIHDMQSGEYGITPRLISAFMSYTTLHVMGG